MSQLDQILEALKKYSVMEFRSRRYHIRFWATGDSVGPGSKPLQEQILASATQLDMKADELMDFDKILNWSAGADPSDVRQPDPSLPLTGDAPL